MRPSTPSAVRSEQQNATTLAAGIARQGFWAIGRERMLAAGVSPEQVRGWLRRGLLHRRYPGVYAWGREELGVEGELAAALLYAGRGSALGGLTALWWRELLRRRPARIHVDTPSRVRSHADVAIRHPRRVRRELHRGLPVTPLPETLLAAAPHLGRDSLRLVLARAEYGRLVSLTELEEALGPGRPGSHALREAMAAHLPQLARCESGLERRFVLLCETEAIELPEPNSRVGRFRPDMLWREAGLVVELDGEGAHSTAAQLAADRARQDWLEAQGLRVLRFRRSEVIEEPGRVAREVRGAI